MELTPAATKAKGGPSRYGSALSPSEVPPIPRSEIEGSLGNGVDDLSGAVLCSQFRLLSLIRHDNHGEVYSVSFLGNASTELEARVYTLSNIPKSLYQYRKRSMKRLSGRLVFKAKHERRTVLVYKTNAKEQRGAAERCILPSSSETHRGSRGSQSDSLVEHTRQPRGNGLSQNPPVEDQKGNISTKGLAESQECAALTLVTQDDHDETDIRKRKAKRPQHLRVLREIINAYDLYEEGQGGTVWRSQGFSWWLERSPFAARFLVAIRHTEAHNPVGLRKLPKLIKVTTMDYDSSTPGTKILEPKVGGWREIEHWTEQVLLSA